MRLQSDVCNVFFACFVAAVNTIATDQYASSICNELIDDVFQFNIDDDRLKVFFLRT